MSAPRLIALVGRRHVLLPAPTSTTLRLVIDIGWCEPTRASSWSARSLV